MIAAALAFSIASATFKPNSTMPVRTVYDKSGCTGGNRSPELHWRGAPAGTRSFAIVMHDPDAPAPGGWYHWVVYDISGATTHLAENAAVTGAQLGTTSWGEHPYGGPCPPPGKVHHYNTTIYALDVAKIPGAHLTGPQLLAAIAKHTLAKATVTCLYRL
ncbi:MAG TPA: YbhB/YbcL family Raf kinase inhibitor-like protein [Candidatus Baltobacteraceae bacterium]|nr:YbhB/YbcL family Raf kinase inhibitor-like protein [Candidatus Baltobacteraceae bacterium]